MKELRVLLIGAGAVGGYIAEQSVKQCIGKLTIVDRDCFDTGNFSKTSALIQYPEDVGKNKAVAIAQRCQPILAEKCSVNGICGDIHDFGPLFFTKVDIVILAVDNIAAKWHVNKMVKMAYPRPALMYCGTLGQFAEAGILDGKDSCIRCEWDESYLVDTTQSTSCRMAYKKAELEGKVPTSSLASSIAANMAMQLILSYVSGDAFYMNAALHYTAREGCIKIEAQPTRPLRRDCDDCKISPPFELLMLQSDTRTLTMSEALSQIEQKLGTDKFKIIPVSPFILEDCCPVCRKKKIVNKPLHRISQRDITCDECIGKTTTTSKKITPEKQLVFTPEQFDKEYGALTLNQLGFRIGGIIEVETGSYFDGETHYFACENENEINLERKN